MRPFPVKSSHLTLGKETSTPDQNGFFARLRDSEVLTRSFDLNGGIMHHAVRGRWHKEYGTFGAGSF